MESLAEIMLIIAQLWMAFLVILGLGAIALLFIQNAIALALYSFFTKSSEIDQKKLTEVEEEISKQEDSPREKLSLGTFSKIVHTIIVDFPIMVIRLCLEFIGNNPKMILFWLLFALCCLLIDILF